MAPLNRIAGRILARDPVDRRIDDVLCSLHHEIAFAPSDRNLRTVHGTLAVLRTLCATLLKKGCYNRGRLETIQHICRDFEQKKPHDVLESDLALLHLELQMY